MWAVWFALLVLMPAQDRTQRKGLTPRIHPSMDQALEEASRRGHAVIVGVELNEKDGEPILFQDLTIARASRAMVSLAVTDYDSDSGFLRARKVTRDRGPCVLVLDPYGNVMDIRPPDVPPALLLASARNAVAISKTIRLELPQIVARARECAAKQDDRGLLEAVRPWLAKHYTGYPELAEIIRIVTERGNARLAEINGGSTQDRVAALRALAQEFKDTPIEAHALVNVARILYEQKGEPESVKKLLRHVMDELPWAENAAAHQEARGILAALRNEELQRRLKELEKQNQQSGN